MPVEAHLPDGPVLVISPELGDAALSCAALLARVDPVTVLDVFTLEPEPDRPSEWDRACGFGSAKEAIAAREQEEANAFSDSYHEVLAVDLLANRYRDELRSDRDERRLRNAINGWVTRSGACTVVLPAGAGLVPGAVPGVWAKVRSLFGGRRPLVADPDHLWVRDTAATILRAHPSVTVWLYEELPHLQSRRADGAVELFARWYGRTAEPIVMPIDRVVKARRIAVYRSQFPVRFRVRTRRRLVRRVPKTERYWALTPDREVATVS
jgi:hypothetical protein